MSKQTEALKLALEALDHNLLFTRLIPRYDGRIIEKAYKAINKALAEQPSQTDWEALAADQAITIALMKAEQPAQQQEPVAWKHKHIEGVAVTHRPSDIDRHPDRWTPLYKGPSPCQTCEALARTVMLDQTSHDAQRQWVGLTEEEHTQIAIDCGCMSADWVFYGAAVERNLKDKNT